MAIPFAGTSPRQLRQACTADNRTRVIVRTQSTIRKAARLYGWLTGFVRSRESYYRQYTLGVIDEDSYLRMESPFLYILEIEHINNFWQNSKGAFNSAFVERTDSQMEGRATKSGEDDFIQGMFSRPD